MSQISPESEGLLPCPFCGKPPAVEMTGFHLGGRTIRCETGDCMGPHTTAACMDDATIQWNRRFEFAQCQQEPVAWIETFYDEDGGRETVIWRDKPRTDCSTISIEPLVRQSPTLSDTSTDRGGK